jgi:hypothetical protein
VGAHTKPVAQGESAPHGRTSQRPVVVLHICIAPHEVEVQRGTHIDPSAPPGQTHGPEAAV